MNSSGDPARLEQSLSPSSKKKASSDKSLQANGVEGVIVRVTNEKVVLSLGDDAGSTVGELGDRLRLVKLANSATFDRMETTLRHVARLVLQPDFIDYGTLPASSVDNADMLRVLFGLKDPEYGPIRTRTDEQGSETVVDDIEWFDPTLNDSQKDAVKFVLRMKEVGCIHGPPGVSRLSMWSETLHRAYPD